MKWLTNIFKDKPNNNSIGELFEIGDRVALIQDKRLDYLREDFGRYRIVDSVELVSKSAWYRMGKQAVKVKGLDYGFYSKVLYKV